MLYLVILVCMCSCAKQKTHVKTSLSPPPKTIILSKTGKEPSSVPYEINGIRYYPLPDSLGFIQYGKASWYGQKFHGRPTASGEIYDMHQKTAAHKTLPLGTVVKVTNLSNKKSTIVRINDRGPFIKTREIDLSYRAAKEISLVGPGLAEVKIVALAKEIEQPHLKKAGTPVIELKDFKRGEFTIQVGAFLYKGNALNLVDRLKVIYEHVTVTRFAGAEGCAYYRVRVSRSQTLRQAGEIEKRLEDMGFNGAFIVRL